MTPDEFKVISDRLPALRKQRVAFQFGEIPGSVEYLYRLIESLTDRPDRLALYTLLISECSRARNDQLLLYYLRKRADEFPEDPMSNSALAFGLAIANPAERKAALRYAYRALDIAVESDRLVRHCATSLARIGLILDDYDAINRALATLVEEGTRSRNDDTAFEFDFVSTIDPGRCDRMLLDRYRDLQVQLESR